MVCEHLKQLEDALTTAGVKETYRGQVWTDNCREWVYFDIVLQTDSLSQKYDFPSCVKVHENLDTKSGTERGFFCETCKDAIIGRLSGAELFE